LIIRQRVFLLQGHTQLYNVHHATQTDSQELRVIVTAVINPIMIIQIIPAILQPDFRQPANNAIILPAGATLPLIMMENISQYIPEAIMVNGAYAAIVIQTLVII
jgi:hypothetical protein